MSKTGKVVLVLIATVCCLFILLLVAISNPSIETQNQRAALDAWVERSLEANEELARKGRALKKALDND